jgi:hypothetical protein
MSYPKLNRASSQPHSAKGNQTNYPKLGWAQANLFPQKEIKQATPSFLVYPHANLILTLQNIMATSCPHPSKPLFEFDLQVKAIEKNFILLTCKFRGDRHLALHAQNGSPLSYGFKFKPASMIKSIIKFHLSWQKMKTVLSKGSVWPLSTLNNSDQLKDIDNTLRIGNHKEVNQQQELLLKLVKDNIIRGFALALPLDKIEKISGILLAPLNIQCQKTINECGEIIPQNRLTHGQSCKWQSGTSVNSQQQSQQNEVNALLLWESPQVAHQLGSCC